MSQRRCLVAATSLPLLLPLSFRCGAPCCSRRRCKSVLLLVLLLLLQCAAVLLQLQLLKRPLLRCAGDDDRVASKDLHEDCRQVRDMLGCGMPCMSPCV